MIEIITCLLTIVNVRHIPLDIDSAVRCCWLFHPVTDAVLHNVHFEITINLDSFHVISVFFWRLSMWTYMICLCIQKIKIYYSYLLRNLDVEMSWRYKWSKILKFIFSDGETRQHNIFSNLPIILKQTLWKLSYKQLSFHVKHAKNY